MEKTGDFYDLLGVQKTASGEEIRTRYHQLAMLYHPDRVQETDKETAHRVFVRINQAYRVLIDPDTRERYDDHLIAKRAGHPISAPPVREYSATDDEITEWMEDATQSYRQGDLQTAHGYCRRIIKSGHGPVEAYILIGDVYVGEREKAKALAAYKVALKMQPQNKMVQAKVLRLEAMLYGPAERSEPAEAAERKKSLLGRLAEIAAKKHT